MLMLDVQLKYQPERPQARVKVLLVRQGISQELRFSVGMYSDCPMRVADGSPGLPFSEKVCQTQLAHMPHQRADDFGGNCKILGKWTGKSAGGSAALPTYIHNPQYSFTIPESTKKTTLRAVLHLDDSVPVNLKLIKSPGPDARLEKWV